MEKIAQTKTRVEAQRGNKKINENNDKMIMSYWKKWPKTKTRVEAQRGNRKINKNNDKMIMSYWKKIAQNQNMGGSTKGQ